jgi:alpha-beta hydrolase superfamily lysophospholipase
MAKRGIATYAIDVRGFGAWRNKECCVLNFPACMQDIRATIAEIRNTHPGAPVFLFGESLGGAIASRFAAAFTQEIDGLILCAPARTLGDYKWEIFWTALRFITRPNDAVCVAESVFKHSPNVVALKKKDPHIRTDFTPGELLHLASFLRKSSKSLAKIDNLPVLFVQGYSDLLIRPRKTLEFFEMIPSKDKDLVIIGEAQHLIFQNTKVPRKAITIVESWIVDHLPAIGLRRIA